MPFFQYSASLLLFYFVLIKESIRSFFSGCFLLVFVALTPGIIIIKTKAFYNALHLTFFIFVVENTKIFPPKIMLTVLQINK